MSYPYKDGAFTLRDGNARVTRMSLETAESVIWARYPDARPVFTPSNSTAWIRLPSGGSCGSGRYYSDAVQDGAALILSAAVAVYMNGSPY